MMRIECVMMRIECVMMRIECVMMRIECVMMRIECVISIIPGPAGTSGLRQTPGQTAAACLLPRG